MDLNVALLVVFHFKVANLHSLCRAVARGRLRGLEPPQCLAEQLTLSQPGGQIMPTTVLQANPPPIFKPCDGPIMEMNKSLIAISTGIKHVKSSQYLPSIRSMKFLSMSLSVFMEIKILDWPFFAVD